MTITCDTAILILFLRVEIRKKCVNMRKHFYLFIKKLQIYSMHIPRGKRVRAKSKKFERIHECANIYINTYFYVRKEKQVRVQFLLTQVVDSVYIQAAKLLVP